MLEILKKKKKHQLFLSVAAAPLFILCLHSCDITMLRMSDSLFKGTVSKYDALFWIEPFDTFTLF